MHQMIEKIVALTSEIGWSWQHGACMSQQTFASGWDQPDDIPEHQNHYFIVILLNTPRLKWVTRGPWPLMYFPYFGLLDYQCSDLEQLNGRCHKYFEMGISQNIWKTILRMSPIVISAKQENYGKVFVNIFIA